MNKQFRAAQITQFQIVQYNYIDTMSRRDPNRKLNFEKTQIRSILSDFRKAKHKCITIYQELNQEMPDKVRFDSVEKQTQLKMELLDLPGLVALKNTLLKTLTELFELESEISTKKQRIKARKQFGAVYPQKNLVGSPNSHSNKNQSMNHTETSKKKYFGEEDEEKDTKAGAQKNKKQGKQQRQLKLPIPMYDIKPENNEHKLERISKFVSNLERSMKDQSEEKNENLKLKEILLNEPEYCKIREELERYRMRDQEIEHLIEERVKEKIRQFCEDMEVLEQTAHYKIVKIFKGDDYEFSEVGSKKNLSHSQILPDRSLHSMIELKPRRSIYDRKKQASLDIGTILKEQVEKDKDIVAIEQQLSKDACNVEDVVSKISSTLQNSQMRLKQLREQRKKIFMDEDIWDEFQKM